MSRVISIQYLRAFAALAVVFHHARNPEDWLYDPLAWFGAGQAGVDLFFVISGYIMFAAARHETTGVFVWRRIVRIVPLYWAATLLAVVLFRGMPPGLPLVAHVAQSLLFIPHDNPMVPGEVTPYLIVGWTLNYEMLFYGLFAIGLLVGRVLVVCSVAILALVTAGLLLPGGGAVWTTYTSPILIEFLAGMIVARVQDRITRPFAVLLLPAGLLYLALGATLDAPRVILWGVPAVALVVGGLAAERSGRLPVVPALLRLGDASYSLYLFQFVGIMVATRIVRALPVAGPLQLGLMIALSLAGCTVLGLLGYYGLDRPLVRRLTRRRGAERRDVLAAP